MIEFRQKDFSILSSTVSGAVSGASIGTIASSMFPKKFREKSNKAWVKKPESIDIIGAGTILGAALGLLWGSTKEVAKAINKNTTVDKRLMQTVVEMLKKSGMREGRQFTRDPKLANELKTKVCIVITRVNGDLRLLVNTVSDPKLKNVTKEMVKNLPNSSVVTEKLSDKFNDITISTISDSSADAGLITGIAQSFIHSGFPVYLVEVG